MFLVGSGAFFSLNVLGNYYLNFRVFGEPMRLVPELDLVWILIAVALLGWLWRQPRRWSRPVAALVVIGAFWTTLPWVRRAWELYPLSEFQNRVEYRVSDWVWKNMPDARLYPTGSVRFWFNAWHDLAQMGGGSEQGLLNEMVQPASWEIMAGPDPEPGVLWMQCLGVDAVFVSDQRSEEPYKDISHSRKFASVLPAVFDDGLGNILYRVPRRYPARARVVETAKLAAVRAPQGNVDTPVLRAYADVVEKGPDAPASLERSGTDGMRVRATVAPGQSILVQEAWDPAWEAWSAGRPLALRKDVMGLIVIDAPPGTHDIVLAFVTPFENRAGRILTLLTVLTLIGLLARRARTEPLS